MDYIFTAMAIILAFLYLGINFIKKNIVKRSSPDFIKCSGCSKSCSKNNNQ